MLLNDVRCNKPIIAGYLGGKSKLYKKIIPLIPPHTCYAEPFCGAGWVFWKKPDSKIEVLNDINKELITLYRVVQNHLEEFIRCFKWSLLSRDEFYRLKSLDPESLTDIQRAARFYYLQRAAFGGKLLCSSFGYSTSRASRLNLIGIKEELSLAQARLSKVIIECLPYQEILKRYDKHHTFFYIDPPYYGCENFYGKNIFDRSDFQNLADILKDLQGNFILSLNDVPEVRDIFSDFKIEEVDVEYSCGKSQTKAKEVLIRNF